MDQDYIRSRYANEGQSAQQAEPASGLAIHLPHLNFGSEGAPWYEARWAVIVFALLLGPIIGVFVWWVMTRYDLEFRVKMIAVGLSVFLALIISALL